MRYITDLLDFAIEREQIRLNREAGLEPPWTKDPVLQSYFFCNVFREDDKLTRWFKNNIRDAVAEDPERSVLACTAFRWFNFIPSGEILRPYLLGTWDSSAAESDFSALKQVVGGAYLIKSPTGKNKTKGLLECIDRVAVEAHDIGWMSVKMGWTLEEMHQKLMEFPYLGRFMAYEIVTDLRHTCVLREASDIMTWASAGPGCARGMGWVVADDPSEFNYGSQRHQRAMLELMREILDCMQSDWPWPRTWEMREVEHVLCEFAKYRAAQSGARVKRRFKC
jgi:hypothetical protein